MVSAILNENHMKNRTEICFAPFCPKAGVTSPTIEGSRVMNGINRSPLVNFDFNYDAFRWLESMYEGLRVFPQSTKTTQSGRTLELTLIKICEENGTCTTPR
jgi:hypothetical protein